MRENRGDMWKEIIQKTQIVRPRIAPLSTHADTQIPYIMLSEDDISSGIRVRKGVVTIEKPRLMLFGGDGFRVTEGFGNSIDEELVFFLVRGVSFPSLAYGNQVDEEQVEYDSLEHIKNSYLDRIREREETSCSLIVGPNDNWQLSILLYTLMATDKNVERDIKTILEKITSPYDES